MKFKKISEGSVSFFLPTAEKISKKMPVFYNPVMKFQRDINVTLLKALGRKLAIADVLAGSGVRSLRFLRETNCVKFILVNDINPKAFELIKKNVKSEKAKITNDNANKILYEYPVFDYIDIDPFGSPNKFLTASIQRLKNKGILGVTATDTAALCGTYKKACIRKYWAVPLRNELMHEIGIRILIRKVQLIGAQYDKALTPLFSHSSNHYMKVYFKCELGAEKTNKILEKHKWFHYCNEHMKNFTSKNNKENCCKKMLTAGPLWIDNLWEPSLVKKMLKFSEHKEFLKTILGEAKINILGFYEIHKLASKLKINPPKKEKMLKYGVSTHFTPTGIKSKLSIEKFKKLMLQF